MRTRIHRPALIVAILLLTAALTNTVLSSEKASAPLSNRKLDQAFAILDALLPSKDGFVMREAPPNGEIINQDGSHYTFNPMVYVPSFGGEDFTQELVARLARNHSRVMTRGDLNTLPKESGYRRLLDGRSYLPKYYDIRWIRPKDSTSARALVKIGTVGAVSDHQILLEHTSGKWIVKENKTVAIYD